MSGSSSKAVLAVALLLTAPAAGGEFDRLEGEALEALTRDARTERPGLTVADLDALPRLIRDEGGGLNVVKTDRGAYARLLVTPALRRAPGEAEGGVPVVVIEKFATFEPGRSGSRVSNGAGLILFDGFSVDLDAGVVVPPGQGGDLTFDAKADGGPRLSAVAPARLFRPEALPKAAAPDAGPTPGKAVVPADVAGRYRLQADGRWTGLLELNVSAEPGHAVTGRFRSEPGGTSYPVRGAVDPAEPGAVAFTIQFPRTEQEYAGRLWTEGKWAIAGTFTMLGRTHGFFAVREGAKWPAD
jgi:hypothetical protein